MLLGHFPRVGTSTAKTSQSSSKTSSTSSTETASPTSYVIVAKSDSSSTDRKSFDTELRKYATTGVSSVLAIDT